MKRLYSTILAVLVIATTTINLYLTYSMIMLPIPIAPPGGIIAIILVSYFIIAMGYMLLEALPDAVDPVWGPT